MSGRSTRDAYGHTLIELGADERIVVIDSDLSRSTRTDWFAAERPRQFFNAGIAEANMVAMGAGMASIGIIPFVTTYAVFIGRAFEQIRQAVAYAGANVKIVATHSGLAASYDGGSHQGIEDLALMRALPGMTVLSPSDYEQASTAVRRAAEIAGPVYLRLGKEDVPDLPPPLETGAAGDRLMRAGDDVAIVATGPMVGEAMRAAESLAAEGIDAAVVDVVSLKPFDRFAVDVAAGCGCAVTAEEHLRIGGLLSALLETLVENRQLVPVVPVALQDEFGQSGGWHELRRHYGLTAESIAGAARRVIRSALPL
jgi:transketolase